MIAPARQRFTFLEYLWLDQNSGLRHEYLDGHVWAMAGGSPDHAAIAANLIALLGALLREGPCRVFTADLRIRVVATGLGTYPDLSVVCGALEADPEDPRGHTVTNPKVLVEVLSPSTEDYDRGEKLAHYKQIPSLEAVLLVAQEERRVEIWRRIRGGWTLDVAHGRDLVALPSLQLRLPLAEIYRGVEGPSRERVSPPAPAATARVRPRKRPRR